MDSIVRWLRGLVGPRRDLLDAVRVHGANGAEGPRTIVRIDDLLPDTGRRGRARWRITTAPQLLPSHHFLPRARAKLKTASKERGRAIACIDLTRNEVVAALSFHVDDDKSLPLLITAIALRVDDPALYDESRACAALVKQYIHAVARKLDRPAVLYLDAHDDSPRATGDLHALGFERASQLPGRPPSASYFRQPPLVAIRDR